MKCNAQKFGQVFINLLVNAAQAIKEKGEITVKTYSDEKHVCIETSDTACGIPKENISKIFDQFFTTKEVGKGTGLGLSTVYGIVKQHGGHITCYSELSGGTIFKMYFPALVSDEELRDTEVRPLPLGGSETILVVDDEELIRDLAARILTKSGYRVITASNGEEALKVYQSQSNEISLIILDLIMPTMGGKDCLKKILEIDPQARVLIASGYSAAGKTKETIDVGAKGFVNKPYDVRQVLQAVRDVLESD